MQKSLAQFAECNLRQAFLPIGSVVSDYQINSNS